MIDWAYQNVIIRGFESGLKRRKTFPYWRELESSQWRSRRDIESLQVRRLRVLLNYCNTYCRWYRDRWAQHGIDVHGISSLADLRAFPITTRAMMRDNAADIRSSQNGIGFVSKATGGSSGAPLRFLIERDANDRRVAAAFRGYGWAGASPGTRQSHLWGVNLNPMSMRRRMKEHFYARLLYRRDLLNSFQMSDSNAGGYVERLNRFRPKVLVAYANPLFVLARAIDERGISVHRPESIIVGSEKLYEHQRALIERVFGSPVYETYGSREFTLIAAECDHHQGLHVTSENMIVEVVDDQGNAVAPGEEGQILVTDLYNTAMPFVRYAIGDRAVAAAGDCSCGRGLPLLEKIVGRQMDVLRLPDGRNLPGAFFPHLIKDISSVRQFQAVQTQPDRIQLKLVVDESWNADDGAELRRRIINTIGESSQLEIRRVDRIDLTAAGKLRVVVAYPDHRTVRQPRIAG
ncbi:Phenylacetate-coenzyme A ligase [Stieleria maiorica]|uniref:Phenylacetate-coenzyme A ligase n=1 Tax=Stieleria maiorica TaxID=2795974 RepID=A0A5B9MPV5_9BACT|nr:phenylacetate--CoA ligase family protein [Stieleria maiorica]QEG02191.1 Phenylacetate-coenzyme A ligase [Stieleria maiorica]